MKYLLVCVVLLFISTLTNATDILVKADSLFEYRDENFNIETLIADTTHINAAMTLYTAVLKNETDQSRRTEALWKLLQAFYFKGQFGTDDKKLKKKIYAEGLAIGEEYVNELNESVEVYSWLGIMWARWAEVYGLFAAARKGVAAKVKFYGERALELDENYLDAGAYRLLGMLNFSVPYIPVILTWPSKEVGLDYLEKANRMAPNNLYNKMYLAEVLHDRKQHARAKKLLNEIINTQGIVHDLAIDSFIKKQARDFLATYY